ncbi:MAG: DUF1513 domain-containing protein [Rhodospirillales bacterium]|nr:DUF1513 domain-containing protein [Rhodospirillales bacterium]
MARNRQWMIDRRGFLASAGAALAGASAPGFAAQNPGDRQARGPAAAFLVPGYRTDLASYRGHPVREAPALRRSFPPEYQDEGTLVTRVDERDGSIRRALMPVFGHAITVRPDGKHAFWNSMNGGSMVSFDPETLELDVFTRPHGDDWIGGGHAVYAPGGDALVVVERKVYGATPGSVAEQFGQITVRDTKTLRVLDAFSSHGVSPHDIKLFDDGKHAAVAHYGTMNVPGPEERPIVGEPSLCVIELSTGKLVQKWTGPHARREVRHLAVGGLDRIAAILSEEGGPEDMVRLRAGEDTIYEPDFSVEPGYSYLPTPVQTYDATNAERPPVEAISDDAMLMRQGQTIVYDPRHDEAIATFTSSHTVVVFAVATGKVRKVIRTDRMGLRSPRGLVLHPDGIHYAVSGSWRGIYQFRRGTHEHVWERDIHTVFFDHSHLSVAAIS